MLHFTVTKLLYKLHHKSAPDGTNFKTKIAETLVKFVVSLQQYISVLGWKTLPLRHIFNVAKLHVCSRKVLQGNYSHYGYLNQCSHQDLHAKR